MIDYRRSKKIIKVIEKELGEQCFSEIEYVMLEYINYKNERVFNYYYLGIDGMYLVEREELIDSDGIQIIYNRTLDIKEICILINHKKFLTVCGYIVIIGL